MNQQSAKKSYSIAKNMTSLLTTTFFVSQENSIFMYCSTSDVIVHGRRRGAACFRLSKVHRTRWFHVQKRLQRLQYVSNAQGIPPQTGDLLCEVVSALTRSSH